MNIEEMEEQCITNRTIMQIQLYQRKLNDDNLMSMIDTSLTKQEISLNLYLNKITHVGVLKLVSKEWKNLVELSLNQNNIGPKGVKYLTRGNWPNIFGLYIGDNNIQNLGAKHLAKGRWPILNSLNVSQKKLTNTGFEYLLDGNWNLKVMWVHQNKNTKLGYVCFVLSKWSELSTFCCYEDNSAEINNYRLKLKSKFQKMDQPF